MEFPVAGVHEARFQAPKAVVNRILDYGFFWLQLPLTLDIKQLYGLARDNGGGGANNRLTQFDRQTWPSLLPIKAASATWAIEKLARQAVLAIGIHTRADLIMLDALARDSETTSINVGLLSFQHGQSAPPQTFLSSSELLVSVAISFDSVFEWSLASRCTPIQPKPLCAAMILGPRFRSETGSGKISWAKAAGPDRGQRKYCYLLSLSTR